MLWGARLEPDEAVAVPQDRFVHVFVAIGRARLGDANLDAGDAARLTDAGEMPLSAGDRGAEVLIWATD